VWQIVLFFGVKNLFGLDQINLEEQDKLDELAEQCFD
jgi:hypothetical protein